MEFKLYLSAGEADAGGVTMNIVLTTSGRADSISDPIYIP